MSILNPIAGTVPQGARGALGVKIQVSPNQKTSLTKVVRHDKGMIKISSAPPEELGIPAKGVSQYYKSLKFHCHLHTNTYLVAQPPFEVVVHFFLLGLVSLYVLVSH